MDTIFFPSVVSHGCGIDVHKKVVIATIGGSGLRKETREFNVFTSSLTELKDWLLANDVTHVAMKSMGVYWEPIYRVLEPCGLIVWIVNACHAKCVPRHKTYKADAALLCKLLLAGLLKPSYIPSREQRELRTCPVIVPSSFSTWLPRRIARCVFWTIATLNYPVFFLTQVV